MASRDLVEGAFDHLLSNRFTTLGRIQNRLNDLEGPGWRGTKELRGLVAEREANEAAAESLFGDEALPVAQIQIAPASAASSVIYDGKRFIGRVDLAYPERRLIIEAQSYRHHSSRQAWTTDVGRRRDLQLLGWRVIEVTWHDVTKGRTEFVGKLRRLLGEMSLLG